MHRHGYKGRKLGRKKDQRRALMKSLADSLIINQTMETTLAKAKEVGPYVENLITHAKKGNLANRRYIISKLNTIEASNKLFDNIAPQLTSRNSGYLRIKRSGLRKGDNAQLAKISFVDSFKENYKKADNNKTTKNVVDKKESVKPEKKNNNAKTPIATGGKK